MRGDVNWKLADIGRRSGLRSEDLVIHKAALLAAHNVLGSHGSSMEPRGLLSELATRLDQVSSAHDGGSFSAEWLPEAFRSNYELDTFEAMRAVIARELDPQDADQMFACAEQIVDELFDSRFHSSLRALAVLLEEFMQLSPGDSVGCAFPMAAAAALRLSRSHEVTFYSGDPTVALTMALLGAATGTRLTIDRRDPLSGAYLGIRAKPASDSYAVLQSCFDHILSIPPAGSRYEMQFSSGRIASGNAEQLQFEAFAGKWAKSLVTVVTEGLLFRSAASDVAVKKRLLGNGLATVLSLPAGVWSRGSGLLTDILELRKGQSDPVCFMDGRTIRGVRKARATSAELSEHLKSLPSLAQSQPERVGWAAAEVIEENQFNLTVDRYVRSDLLHELDTRLGKVPVASLEDIAEIIRPQAVQPLRQTEGKAFMAREITTADIEQGIVLKPGKLAAYRENDRDRVLKAQVRSGDVVISTKGKVGIVGLVPDWDLTIAEVEGEPWVVSQSFAIVRLRKTADLREGRILAAMLGAPWAVEQLQALAGGSTVPMIPMNDLRKFPLPIPDRETQCSAAADLDRMAELAAQLAGLQETIREERTRLSSVLWNMPLNNGEFADA